MKENEEIFYESKDDKIKNEKKTSLEEIMLKSLKMQTE
jgi:hypothetical protein